MANEPVTTIVGNLTNDPELRYAPNGDAVTNFTIASTPRSFDRNSNEWKDGETLFIRCSLWRQYAENFASSVSKGTSVMAQGLLKSRSYEKDGQKHTVIEMEVQDVGPTLRYATATVTRTQGNGGGGQQGGGRQQNNGGQRGGNSQQGRQQGQQQQVQQDDPWGAPEGGNSNWGL